MISPCRCSGSLKYMHRHCLCIWISTSKEGNTERPESIDRYTCEICHALVICEIEKNTLWRTKKEICQEINQTKKTCLRFVIHLLTIFAFFAAAFTLFGVWLQKITSGNSSNSGGEIGGIIFFVLCLLATGGIMLYFLFKNYFQKTVFCLRSAVMQSGSSLIDIIESNKDFKEPKIEEF